MRSVLLHGPGFEPVIANRATRFHERLIGRWYPDALDSTLIDTRSVHSFGLTEPIGVVGLDADLTVVGYAILKPNRIVWFRSAKHILEIPAEWGFPDLGSKLAIADV